MDQKLNCKSCSECIHLQKDDPIISGDMALYRCTNQMRGGRCIGWVQKDKPNSGLNTQGGSCCNVLYPGDMFDVTSRFGNKYKRYLYCGNKQGTRILLGIPDLVYTPVPSDYFRTQTGKLKTNIKIVMQTEEQRFKSVKLAKKIIWKKKVIDKMKDIGKRFCESVNCNKDCENCEHAVLMNALINVVKKGGRDE